MGEVSNEEHLKDIALWLGKTKFNVKKDIGSLHADGDSQLGDTYCIDCIVKSGDTMYLYLGKTCRGMSATLLANYQVGSAQEIKEVLRKQQDFARDFGATCFEGVPVH